MIYLNFDTFYSNKWTVLSSFDLGKLKQQKSPAFARPFVQKLEGNFHINTLSKILLFYKFYAILQ